MDKKTGAVELITKGGEETSVKCKYGGHEGTTWRTLRLKDDPKIVLHWWFLCPTCSPAHIVLPETAEEAYEMYLEAKETKKAIRKTCRSLGEFIPS